MLENAFTEGRQTFNDMLCDRKKDKAWISDRASIKDVLQAVSDARDKYHAKRTSKAWKWLTQLSARVNYYGSILDVMVQHHPEYAALAWGAMKVLFVVRNYITLGISPLTPTGRALRTTKSPSISLRRPYIDSPIVYPDKN